jgi:hypothetical protein
VSTTTTTDLLAAVAEREQTSASDATDRYQALARRLAAGEPKGDTPQKVAALLAEAGRTSADLRADVAALQAHEGLRAAARGVVSLEADAEAASHEVARVREEQRQAERAYRDRLAAARSTADEAQERARGATEQGERLLALAASKLRERVEQARGAWQGAAYNLRVASALAAGWDPRAAGGFQFGADLPDVAHDPDTVAKLTATEAKARAALEAAWRAVLDVPAKVGR